MQHDWDITYFDLGRRGPWGSTWHVLRGRNTCNRNKYLKSDIKSVTTFRHLRTRTAKRNESDDHMGSGEGKILKQFLSV